MKKVMDPVVLFQDFAGDFAPLHNCYYSAGKLISRKNANDEVYSQYCPQCLTVYSSNSTVAATSTSSSAVKNKCPFCVLCPLCCSTVNMAVTSSSPDRIFYFECSYCSYNTSGESWLNNDGDTCSECQLLQENQESATGDNDDGGVKPSPQHLLLANPFPQLVGANKDELFRRLTSAANTNGNSSGSSCDIAALVKCFQKQQQQQQQQQRGDSDMGTGTGMGPAVGSTSTTDAGSESNEYFNPLSVLQRESFLYRLPSATVLVSQQQHSDPPLTAGLRQHMPRRHCGYPTFTPLLCKYTVRTRTTDKARIVGSTTGPSGSGSLSSASGSVGSILVQAKASPLDGDSSNKLQRGKWWGKDASAVHELPSVCVRRVTVLAPRGRQVQEKSSSSCSSGSDAEDAVVSTETVTVTVELDITNPKEGDCRMRVHRRWDPLDCMPEDDRHYDHRTTSWHYKHADPHFRCAKPLPCCTAAPNKSATATGSVCQGQNQNQNHHTLHFDLPSLGLDADLTGGNSCSAGAGAGVGLGAERGAAGVVSYLPVADWKSLAAATGRAIGTGTGTGTGTVEEKAALLPSPLLVLDTTLGGYVDELLVDAEEEEEQQQRQQQPLEESILHQQTLGLTSSVSGCTHWRVVHAHRNVVTVRVQAEFDVSVAAAATTTTAVGVLDFSLEYCASVTTATAAATSIANSNKTYACRVLLPLPLPLTPPAVAKH